MKKQVLLSIVIPVLNEENILWQTAEDVASQMDELVGPGNWQLVVCDNGSTDATPRIIDEICLRWPVSVPVSLPKANIGAALRAGFYASEGHWAQIIPVDERDSEFSAWSWKYRDRYDLMVGSKRADPTINFQTPYRRFLSWGLNSLLDLLVGLVGTDTHGPKQLNVETMRPIIDRCVMARGQFDTELTLRAIRAGLRVAEVPVVHKEKRPTRNRMITKVSRNVRDLFRLRRALRDEPWNGPIRFHRWSRADVTELVLPASAHDQECE